jgi:hypothetical protein
LLISLGKILKKNCSGVICGWLGNHLRRSMRLVHGKDRTSQKVRAFAESPRLSSFPKYSKSGADNGLMRRGEKPAPAAKR